MTDPVFCSSLRTDTISLVEPSFLSLVVMDEREDDKVWEGTEHLGP